MRVLTSIAEYRCQNKYCKAKKVFVVSQPGSIGTRITCVKCKTFLGMKRVGQTMHIIFYEDGDGKIARWWRIRCATEREAQAKVDELQLTYPGYLFFFRKIGQLMFILFLVVSGIYFLFSNGCPQLNKYSPIIGVLYLLALYTTTR